jgi:leucyl aminopeptidase
MQFSSFQKNLDNWQGASLIFGVLEEDIAGQLENIKFVIDPKLKNLKEKKEKL